MPRRKSGAKLWWDKDRETWTIIDGRFNRRTGFGAADLKQAESALRDYIEGKHKPASGPDPLIADVIAVYAEEHTKHTASGKHVRYDLERLTKWWGEKRVSEINAPSCRGYIAQRSAPTICRRELGILRAAVRYWQAEKAPTMAVPRFTLPPKPDPRQDYMTRSEAARFLWAARRTPHLARFFLIGWYTGSRRSVITGLKWSMIDLESGVMKRRARNAARTKKRAPPVKLGTRILAHLARWKRLDGGRAEHVINYKGNKIDRPVSSWDRVRSEAGLPAYVVPHVLRHSRATYLMKAGVSVWEAANALGMSVAVLVDVYGHHSPDWQKDAANVR